jgi:hypothetical protein
MLERAPITEWSTVLVETMGSVLFKAVHYFKKMIQGKVYSKH